jgi:hypothetical protein
MADELRVVNDELHRRGWEFRGFQQTIDGGGQFVAERASNGAFAMAPTATGLLLIIQRLGGNE